MRQAWRPTAAIARVAAVRRTWRPVRGAWSATGRPAHPTARPVPSPSRPARARTPAPGPAANAAVPPVPTHSTTVPEAPASTNGPAAAATPGTTPATPRPPAETRRDPRIRSTAASSGAASEPKPRAAVPHPNPVSPACQCWWLRLSRPTPRALSTKLCSATTAMAAGTPGRAQHGRQPALRYLGRGRPPPPHSRRPSSSTHAASANERQRVPRSRRHADSSSSPPMAGPTTKAATSTVTRRLVSGRCGHRRTAVARRHPAGYAGVPAATVNTASRTATPSWSASSATPHPASSRARHAGGPAQHPGCGRGGRPGSRPPQRGPHRAASGPRRSAPATGRCRSADHTSASSNGHGIAVAVAAREWETSRRTAG